MATTLDKDLIRESSLKVDNREIIVTLTADQQIKMKLKGMKSGTLSVPIDKLFNDLNGSGAAAEGQSDISDPRLKRRKEKPLQGSDAHMISLHDLRTHNLIEPSDDLAVKVRLEFIISEVLKRQK